MKPLRVEMVVPSLIAAGMEQVVATLVRALARRGHQVGVTCTLQVGTVGTLLQAAGHPVRVVPAPGLLTNLWPSALTRHLIGVRPDVVHVHSGVWLKAARAAWLADRIPLVHTVHGLLDHEPWHERPLKKIAARYTTALVAVSEALRRDLMERIGISHPKPRVILNGVDTQRFTPGCPSAGLRRQLGLDETCLLVGHVGRLAPVKNHEMLLRAFAEVSRQIAAAHLVLVGDGELRAAIGERVTALGLQQRVHLVGERQDLPNVYRDLDVFVLPSHAEGTSISLLEAMSSGVACVATAVGGSPAVLADGAAGRLVPAGNTVALAQALRSLLESREEREELARRARERAARQYGERVMTDAYEGLYREIVGARDAA